MPSAVFILLRKGRLLMEQRPDDDDDFFPRAWLFPGGKLQQGESPDDGLRREMAEELGVRPMGLLRLAGDDEIYYARPGEQSHRLYPYLVTSWLGTVPDRVLDSGAVLAWRTLDEALASPVDCTRQMAERVRDVLSGSVPHA